MDQDFINSLMDTANTDFQKLYESSRGKPESKFAQQKDGWCGPAALSYAMAQQGLEISQKSIAKTTGTTVKNGVDPKYLANEARRFGFVVETYSGEDPRQTIKKLDQALLDEKSVIVDYLEGDDIDNDGHYVVFQGSTGGKVILWDPSKARNIVLDKDKFIAQWKDKTIGGKIFKYWSMIFSKPI